MSLILDALRKMEQDRNSRRGSAQDLRPEVLRYRRAPGPQRTLPLLPIVAGLVALVCVVGAGLLLKTHRAATAARQETAAPPAIQPPAPPTPAVLPAPVAVPVSPTTAVPSPAPVAADPVRPPVAEPSPARAEPVAKPRKRAAARQEAAPAPATSAALPPATDITLSGIAWQDERALRRAVLNGNLVGEGALVAGARVVEIREDRVKLSRNGQLFETVLSSSVGSH